MTFLVDADLPRSTADVVRRHGYAAVDVRDIGLRHAEDRVIATHAQRAQQCLVTGDFDFADIRNYPPQDYAGIVVLIIPPTATATYITQLLDSFLVQKALIAQLPGKTTGQRQGCAPVGNRIRTAHAYEPGFALRDLRAFGRAKNQT